MPHTFNIISGDTDSIMFTKGDQSPFTSEEQQSLVEEINSLLPERIKMSHDGYYPTAIILKAKNYILYDGEKIKYKGSAVKATVKEPALKQFIKDLIDAMLSGNYDFVEIYNRYVLEIMDMKDIRRWVSKRTISDKVMAAARTNELLIKQAIEGTEYQEGDKPYFFYKSDGSLCLVEHYTGDYSKDRLLEKLHNTVYTFETVIDPQLFPNYKLKRNKAALEELINRENSLASQQAS